MLTNKEFSTWALHNPLKGWTLKSLSLEQAQLIVLTLTTAEYKVCLVWKSEWPQWLPLEAPPAQILFNSVIESSVETPPIPQSLLNTTGEEITQVRPVLNNKKAVVSRKFARFDAKVPCEVIVGENIFTTSSRDISEGGFCFNDPLPEWVAGYFTVVVKGSQQIELTCMLVEDQKNQKFRAEIIDLEHPSVQILKDWLIQSQFTKVSV